MNDKEKEAQKRKNEFTMLKKKARCMNYLDWEKNNNINRSREYRKKRGF